MCCESEVFVDLCKLYPRSAELVIKDAQVRNERLLEFRHSKRHLKPETETHKRFDNLLSNVSGEALLQRRKNKTKKAQNVLVRTLLKLKAQKREEDYRKLVNIMIQSVSQTFANQSTKEIGNSEVYTDFMASARQVLKSRHQKYLNNLTGYRAPGILKVIGEALTKRLCLVDMSFMLEDEEADGEEKLKKIKDKNRRINSQMAEVNGALIQTIEKIVKK